MMTPDLDMDHWQQPEKGEHDLDLIFRRADEGTRHHTPQAILLGLEGIFNRLRNPGIHSSNNIAQALIPKQ